VTEPSAERPQDEGRRHRRKGAPSAATLSLLADYQEAMRSELRTLLTDLQPKAQDQGLGLVAMPPKRPPLAERSKMWDLAIKLGRELGSEIDPAPPPVVRGPSRPRRSKVDYG
jgi:hypothetical protein